MATFAMILAAGLAIGDGPGRVSGEIAEFQRLDLHGKWAGTCRASDGMDMNAELEFPSSSSYRGYVTLWTAAGRVFRGVTITDEGRGRLRITWGRGETSLGVYEQKDDRLVLCLSEGRKRPASFRAGNGQSLYVLRRIKPRK